MLRERGLDGRPAAAFLEEAHVCRAGQHHILQAPQDVRGNAELSSMSSEGGEEGRQQAELPAQEQRPLVQNRYDRMLAQ